MTGGDDTILAEEDAARKSAGESLFLFSPPHSSSAPKVERTETVEKSNPPECLMSSHNVAGDVLSLNEHKEALKLQELLFQDKLLQKEREILMKENENQDMKSKYEATVEAQAQMRYSCWCICLLYNLHNPFVIDKLSGNMKRRYLN